MTDDDAYSVARFVPGLITIQLITLFFPIHQIFKHRQALVEAKQREQDLANFEARRQQGRNGIYDDRLHWFERQNVHYGVT